MTTSATPSILPTTLRIEGEMSIYRAQELKDLLMAPLKPGVALEVDLSGVTEFDTVGLQLLILAKRTAQQQQGALRLIRHSPAVLDVFEILHLAPYFGDVLVPSSSGSSPSMLS